MRTLSAGSRSGTSWFTRDSPHRMKPTATHINPLRYFLLSRSSVEQPHRHSDESIILATSLLGYPDECLGARCWIPCHELVYNPRTTVGHFGEEKSQRVEMHKILVSFDEHSVSPMMCNRRRSSERFPDAIPPLLAGRCLTRDRRHGTPWTLAGDSAGIPGASIAGTVTPNLTMTEKSDFQVSCRCQGVHTGYKSNTGLRRPYGGRPAGDTNHPRSLVHSRVDSRLNSGPGPLFLFVLVVILMVYPWKRLSSVMRRGAQGRSPGDQ